ncbi:MAG TPA: signal peptidase I [Thermoleophilia bacterium]|nr:signal peptidase I [Thermoleophilia bacterium]
MLRRIRPEKGSRRVIIDYGLTALVAIAMAVVVQSFVIKPYLIPSTSMANTLVPGQRVLVDRMVYRYRSVHRGDIIVFRRPCPPNDVLIKRVVGLPGDIMSVSNGDLYVNGHEMTEPYVDKVNGVAEPTDPADSLTSGDPNAPWSLTQPYRVPAGHYFVMGDNRTDSADSRYWGTVPRAAIIGRAFFTYWPLGRVGQL